MVEMLLHQGVELLAFSLGGMHFHALARFGELPAKRTVGRAKKHAYHIVQGAACIGRIWARGCRPEPIANRAHQVRTYRYILEHAQDGAWVWSYKQGVHWETTLRLGKDEA